jgi:hypothetical protein
MSPQEQRRPPAGRWEVLSAGELPELVGVSSLRLSAGFPTLRHFFPANLQVAPIVGAKAASRRNAATLPGTRRSRMDGRQVEMTLAFWFMTALRRRCSSSSAEDVDTTIMTTMVLM